MSGLIRPTRSGTVTLPDNQMGSGGIGINRGQMMGQQQNPMQQQMSEADSLRTMLSQGLGATGGNGTGFNWSNSGNSMYEDEVVRSLRGNTEESTDSLTYYIERVSPGVKEFMRQIFHRMTGGLLFEEFKKARDNFRLNPTTMHPDEVCNAFVDDINKHHEFTKIIAVNGAPFFGRELIETLRQTNRDTLNQGDYLAAVNIAVRNVLYFEMISWLTKSSRGKMYALNLPRHLAAKVSELEKYKEIADKTYDIFGQTSPYAGLEFKRPESTRPDFAMLYGSMMGYNDHLYDSRQGSFHTDTTQLPPNAEQYKDVFEMVYRNAEARRRELAGLPQNTRESYQTVDGATTNWNGSRKDFENLTPQNKGEFNLRQFFHPIGREHHYYVTESDWKNIKHAFKKHPSMGHEETAMSGCFRIVNINLDEDSGWMSTIVRDNNLDIFMAVSNPHKLLPLLDNPNDMSMFTVKAVNLEDVGSKEDLHIEVETCQELEKEIPLIVVNEEIKAVNSKDIEATILRANSKVSENFREENATNFKVVNWDTFACKSVEDKTRLYHDLPFLFKDGKGEQNKSFFQVCREVSGFVRDGIVNHEVTDFIGERLTALVNEWLVNHMGYDLDPESENHLSVDNVLEDFRDLSEHLKEHDQVAYHDLHETNPNHYLPSVTKIFTYTQPEPEGRELTAIERMQREVDLVVEREMCITVVNRRGGPIHTPGEVVYIKRSKFPEYFQLMEKGFDKTMGRGYNPDTTDQIIMFSDSKNMWLFTQSAVDPNVATLRHISRKDPLVVMSLD